MHFQKNLMWFNFWRKVTMCSWDCIFFSHAIHFEQSLYIILNYFFSAEVVNESKTVSLRFTYRTVFKFFQRKLNFCVCLRASSTFVRPFCKWWVSERLKNFEKCNANNPYTHTKTINFLWRTHDFIMWSIEFIDRNWISDLHKSNSFFNRIYRRKFSICVYAICICWASEWHTEI